ncbi:MAG TPA: hypothetical protein DIT55_09675 [Spirochaetaceae bacterium]|nr:hypothetical protein [Spirochaetaceae bacterium]
MTNQYSLACKKLPFFRSGARNAATRGRTRVPCFSKLTLSANLPVHMENPLSLAHGRTPAISFSIVHHSYIM